MVAYIKADQNGPTINQSNQQVYYSYTTFWQPAALFIMSNTLLIVQCGLLVPIVITCLIHNGSSASILSKLQTVSSNAAILDRSVRNTQSSSNTLEIGGCTCTNTNTDECTSLEQAIFNSQSMLDLEDDSPYNFFTLRDLYYSGLLDHRNTSSLEPSRNGTDFNSTTESNDAEDRCDHLKHRFIFLERTNDRRCAWKYECTQNQHLFPSFHFKAVLENEGNEQICEKVIVDNVKRFVRTDCVHDKTLPHWLECKCENTVVAYIWLGMYHC